jgi:hypothetical protein
MTEKYNPFVVAIRFGDNDFYYTFTTLLRTLGLMANESDKYKNLDKTTLLKILNDLVYPMYRLSQNKYEYTNGKTEEEYSTHIKNYLKIKKDNLLIGRVEVDQYISDNPWDNGETFILDTRLPVNQQVYVI